MTEIINTSGSIQASEIDDYRKLQKTYEDARIKLENFEKKLKFDNTKKSNGSSYDGLNRILELREEHFQMELKQLDSSTKKDTEEEWRIKSDLKKWKSKTTNTQNENKL